ncbi:hypothetical protein DERP_002691 [Dermatophagoides pteronyssinus]|uniref:Uncharacterized protein n=1 Tax=Dermatophagoides pteronyssinus TaxID=6956 RepID=A0ABQ8JVL8_DERPT|nr:hypothetical protein DERP_002691 [Dermatophagoides pteronyssinus]
MLQSNSRTIFSNTFFVCSVNKLLTVSLVESIFSFICGSNCFNISSNAFFDTGSFKSTGLNPSITYGSTQISQPHCACLSLDMQHQPFGMYKHVEMLLYDKA